MVTHTPPAPCSQCGRITAPQVLHIVRGARTQKLCESCWRKHFEVISTARPVYVDIDWLGPRGAA